MFKQLTEEAFLLLAATHSRIVVYKEVLGDQFTPVQVFQALSAHMKGATLLESNPREKNAGRYSFLGFTPMATLTIREGAHEAPLAAIREFYQSQRAIMTHPLSGFSGGITGFLTYDAARFFEDTLGTRHLNGMLPDIMFKSYQDHVMFDKETGQVVLATVVDLTNTEPKKLYQSAIKRLHDFHQTMLSPGAFTPEYLGDEPPTGAYTTRVDDEAFMAACMKAKAHIQAGDAFQIVLSRTFETPCRANPFDIYRMLRHNNPSPYMFYLDNEEGIILGASPEKMISVKDGKVQSSPLAGTRPRGTGYDDSVQSADLLSDTKEVSEHMMLVDLARNDIGAVSKPGSVSVAALMQIKLFSHVMHLSSTVEGVLDEGKDALDALSATFPAGTLSGAPKIRAMQIIDTLEEKRRGLYGGVIGFINSQGDFDSCIAIRMALVKEGVAYVTAGAGIVFDSDVQKESDETRHKAKAVLEAVAFASRGLS